MTVTSRSTGLSSTKTCASTHCACSSWATISGCTSPWRASRGRRPTDLACDAGDGVTQSIVRLQSISAGGGCGVLGSTAGAISGCVCVGACAPQVSRSETRGQAQGMVLAHTRLPGRRPGGTTRLHVRRPAVQCDAKPCFCCCIVTGSAVGTHAACIKIRKVGVSHTVMCVVCRHIQDHHNGQAQLWAGPCCSWSYHAGC
jgi:hypothetical protein